MYQLVLFLFGISLCGVVYIMHYAWQLKREGDKLKKKMKLLI